MMASAAKGDVKAKAGGGPKGGASTQGAPDTAGTAGGGKVGRAGITLQTNRGVRRLGAGGLGSSAWPENGVGGVQACVGAAHWLECGAMGAGASQASVDASEGPPLGSPCKGECVVVPSSQPREGGDAHGLHESRRERPCVDARLCESPAKWRPDAGADEAAAVAMERASSV